MPCARAHRLDLLHGIQFKCTHLLESRALRFCLNSSGSEPVTVPLQLHCPSRSMELREGQSALDGLIVRRPTPFFEREVIKRRHTTTVCISLVFDKEGEYRYIMHSPCLEQGRDIPLQHASQSPVVFFQSCNQQGEHALQTKIGVLECIANLTVRFQILVYFLLNSTGTFGRRDLHGMN